MARGNRSDNTEAPVEGTAAETGTQEGGNDSRFIMVNVPEGDPVTQLGGAPENSGVAAGTALALSAGPQKRVDVIRALARTGEWERGTIAKHLSKLEGRKVAYQIVFQATRGIPNVKKAQRAEAVPSAATGEAAPVEGAAEVPVEA